MELLQKLPETTLSPEERDLRRRGFVLVGTYWSELRPRVVGWLGTAYREDDGLADEVALVLLHRISHGQAFVTRLRDIPVGDTREKSLLFSNARFVTAELVRQAQKARTPTESGIRAAAIAAPPGDLPEVSVVTAQVAKRVRQDRERLEAAKLSTKPDARVAFDPWLTNLLMVGAEVWESLCVAGLLDRSHWSSDEKWTAIGMMWGFSARNIARIRYLMAGANSTVLDIDDRSTHMVMRRVRAKGGKALAGMAEALRLDYGLPAGSRPDRGLG
jgi:hypothetical protein